MKTSMKGLSALSIAAMLALTGCSSGSSIEEFCDISASLDSRVDIFDEVNDPTDAFTAAATGDLEPLHQWGKDGNASLAAIVSEMERAQAAAPDEETADAIGVVIEGFGTFGGMLDAAESAEDFESFMTYITDSQDDFNELGEKQDDAATLIDEKTQELCPAN